MLGVNSTVPPGGLLKCGRTERATSLERHGFSVLGALSIETSACSSFGITGTRPWPRWRHLPPSLLLSWWLLALLRWRKVGGDRLTETREIAPYLWVHPDEERWSLGSRSVYCERSVVGFAR